MSKRKFEAQISMEQMNRIICSRLKNVRRRRKLRQTDVATWIGVDQSALSRIESGKQVLTAAQWVAFSSRTQVKRDGLTQFVQRVVAWRLQIQGLLPHDHQRVSRHAGARALEVRVSKISRSTDAQAEPGHFNNREYA